MNIQEIKEITKRISDIENSIDKHTKWYMSQIYYVLKNISSEIPELKLGNLNEKSLSFKFFDYEFFVTYMDDYAVPKELIPRLKNEFVTIKRISEDLQGFYCSCITFCYNKPQYDPSDFILQDRMFINNDGEAAFEGLNEIILLEPKDEVTKTLNPTITNILGRLFIDVETRFPKKNDVFIIKRENLYKRKYGNIGF